MDTIVLLLLGGGFALLAFTGWRSRAAADPASSVEGFARVLAAIDPESKQPVEFDPIEVIEEHAPEPQVPDFR